MAEYLKEHGAKVALGLGAIVVTYVLYTCVVAPEEEPKVEEQKDEVKEESAPAENVTVETPQIAEVDQNTVAADAVEDKIEVAEPVIIEDSLPVEEQVEEEVQEKAEVEEEPAVEEAAEETVHNDKMAQLIRAKMEETIATTQTELKDAEEAEVKAEEEAEAARVEAEAAAKLAAEKAAAEAAAKALDDAAAAAKAKEEAEAAAKAQADKEALQKQRDEAAAAAKKAKEEALAKAAAAKKAKEEADAKALAAKVEADAKAKRAADEKARLAAEAARLAIKTGILKLTVQRADISVNTDMGGKMDPYVNLEMVDQNKKSYFKARTQAHVGGHMKPVWNEEFVLNVKDYNHLIRLSVFEKDTFSDDHIGDGTFTAKQFSTPGTTKEFQRCHLKDKESARVYITGVWTPKE